MIEGPLRGTVVLGRLEARKLLAVELIIRSVK